jgi:hypothetical protein
VRRKLSTIEQVLDGNVVYFIRLDGTLDVDRLRSALSSVQGKHPALRALIREERDGLYYEENKAPAIPLRIVSRVSEDDYRRECQTELNTVFAYDQPQLRLVWLRSERESDLLLTTSHRICDGMSIFILVKEVLQSLHSDQELVPYETVTLRDMIGRHRPPKPWAFKLKLFLMNGMLGLIPSSRSTPENKEHHLEWASDAALLAALKRRCRAEGVSVHAALIVTLERSLFAVFGRKKLPKWIDNPMDIRRGHFPALKNDTVFFAGGSFKLRIGEAQNVGESTRGLRTDACTDRAGDARHSRSLLSLGEASLSDREADPVDCTDGRCVEIKRQLESIRVVEFRQYCHRRP